MQKRDYANKAYNLHLINTNRFKTILFKFIFRDNLTKEDITKRNLLISMLEISCKKYPSLRELCIHKEELYNFTTSFSNRRVGKQVFTECCFTIINPKYTNKQMLKESINFIKEILFNPYIVNDDFDKDLFKVNYDYLQEQIKEAKTNPNSYAMQRLKEELDKNNVFSINLDGYQEDLEKITEENLYDYYKEFFNKNLIDIYVVGDFDFYEMENLMKDIIPFKVCKKPKNGILNNCEKTRKNIKKVTEDSTFNQSKLLIGLNINKPTDIERKYTLVLYNMILGNSPEAKLFTNVREKLSLCYDITSMYSKNDNGIVIATGIKKDNYKLCLRQIKQELKKIQKGDFDDKHLANCKTLIKSLLDEFEDYPNSIAEYYFSIDYFNNANIEEQKKHLDSITKEDIINVAKKITIDTIYFLKEKQSDEENCN